MRSDDVAATIVDMTLMQQTHPETPGLGFATLCDAFLATVDANPDRVALRSLGGTESLTWSQYAERVQRIAGGLAAMGTTRGDVVALMLTQRIEAPCVDAAAMMLGAITVPLYPGDSVENISHILNDCGARVLVTERALIDKATGPSSGVVHFVTVDDGPAGMTTLAQLEAAGDPRFDLGHGVSRGPDPDDTVSILYTSGTTGPPKGVIHTHAMAIAGLESLETGSPEGDVSYVSFLPFAHLGEHGLGYWRALIRGSTTTFCPDPSWLEVALVDSRPTWIFAPPRIWERLKLAIEESGIVDPQTARERFGLDRLTQAITGAAACPADVLTFFRELGIPMSELWGMTEVWIATLTRSASDIGTVGRAMPGFELCLADDGELLVRGPAVTPGYFNRPDATAELFDDDGWLRTGDLATIDGQGRVRIVDRKKEMIINSAGHNMSPANIENALKSSSSLIAHACCVGEGRDFVVALISLNAAEARRVASALGDDSLERLAADAGVRARLATAIAGLNECLDERERVMRHAIVPDAWLPGELLTPTMKLRRRAIVGRYGDAIEQLYAE